MKGRAPFFFPSARTARKRFGGVDMIQVTNLTKVFRGETDVTALTGINLNVDDGDI